MDPLSILLQLFKPGDPSFQRILLQNQLQKCSLQINNETHPSSASTQVPASSSFTPDRSQTELTQSYTSSPLQPQFLFQSIYPQAEINNPSSQPNNNIIQECIQQDAEKRRRHQKLLTDQIESQHERMKAMIDGLAEEKEQLEKKVHDLERIISEKLKCPFEDCHKSYQSEHSLAQHIKIKHNSRIKPTDTTELPSSLIPPIDNNKLINDNESKIKQEQKSIPPDN